MGLLLSAFTCYFKWGNNSSFLLVIQYELLFKSEKASLLHPLIIAPALGELALLISIFIPNKKLILTGLILLGIIVAMVLLAGILSAQMGMVVSTLPYLLVSADFLRKYKKI